MPNTSAVGLLVFVKVPEAGKVKTRLGRTIGVDRACDLYRCFGVDWLRRLQQLDVPLLVFFAPDDGRTQIREWLSVDSLYPQGEGTLGDRMQRAFETGFGLGLEHLMIFGSDSPDIPLTAIRHGLASLMAGKIVLGASNDGGYYTIGFSQRSWYPQAFHHIEWSREQVYSDTLKRLRTQTYPIELLPQWDDIDTVADLKNLVERNADRDRLPRTMRYIRQHLADLDGIKL